MPVHDWMRVDAGTFHSFHNAWITHLMGALNAGRLPEGYYALSERHAGQRIADVLTLQMPAPVPDPPERGGAVAVAEVPPRVSQRLTASPDAVYRALRQTLAIRRTDGHRIVALIEILSRSNKDRPTSVDDFVEKVVSALRAGVHVLIVDLFPSGRHDPKGIHGAIWDEFDSDACGPPADRPVILASYDAGEIAEAYVEYLAVGAGIPEMPLFLESRAYVNIPLEPPYEAAFRDLPSFWREVVEGRRDAPRPPR